MTDINVNVRVATPGVRMGDMFMPATVLDTVFKPDNATGDDGPWVHCREGPKYSENLHRSACAQDTARVAFRPSHNAKFSLQQLRGFSDSALPLPTRACRDPEVDVPFDFMTVVDMAPLAVKAEAFVDIGADPPCFFPLRRLAWLTRALSGCP